MVNSILSLRQCPHCSTNLVGAEILIPHTCEPGAFHSRLLGVRSDEGALSGWSCPDCETFFSDHGSSETAKPMESGEHEKRLKLLEDNFKNLEIFVMSIADALKHANIGCDFEVSKALEKYSHGYRVK